MLVGYALLAVLVPLAQEPQTAVAATDRFELELSAAGGVPLRWTLRDGGVELVDRAFAARSTIAPLGLVLDHGEADRRTYALVRTQDGAGERLVFTSPSAPSGLQVVRTWEVTPNRSSVGLRLELHNGGTAPLRLTGVGLMIGPGLGIAPTRVPELAQDAWLASVRPFFVIDGDIVSGEAPYAPPWTVPFVHEGGAVSAAGLQSQYLALAVVANPAFASATLGRDPATAATAPFTEADLAFYPSVTARHDTIELAPGATWTTSYVVYAGPKDRDALAQVAPELAALPFHHLPVWLAAICSMLQRVLGAMHGVIGSWGWSILAFAVLFRVITLPLSLFGARSQMKLRMAMAALKPEVAAAKRQHTKPEARNRAILDLYKQHGISPVSNFKGCLPLVVQLPILIGLFQLLLNSHELRGQSFVWIADLTRTDRLFSLPFTIPWLGDAFNLLPLLMLGGQLLITKTIAAATTPAGKSSAGLYALPVLMTLLFYPFPAGCMVFWTTGTLLQVFEQRAAAARLRA